MRRLAGIIHKLRILPRWIIIVIDLIIIAFSTLLGYGLRFNFEIQAIVNHNFTIGIFINVICGFTAVLITRSYAGIVRYTGLRDGVRLINTLVINLALMLGLNYLFFRSYGQQLIPYSVLLVAFLASFLFLFMYRLLVKSVFSMYRIGPRKRINIMIFGAGQSGIITKQVIDNSEHSQLKVVGFLEDDIHKVGKLINGTRIFNAYDDYDRMVEDLQVEELIISVRNLSIDRKNEIVDSCLRNNVKVRSVPPVHKWVKGELSLKQIKEVRIEDLLGRESIRLDNENIAREILGRRVVITGAAGSIGSELVRQVIQYRPSKLVLIDQAESPLYEIEREITPLKGEVKVFPFIADITNSPRMETIFSDFRPEIIFHAAAYKHVPMMESNPSEAIQCNIIGTRNLADLSVKYNVKKFVMISTDKAVNPTNVMGCSKRIAEIYVQSLNNKLQMEGDLRTSFVTTRFGNVLGSNGSVIPFFKKQIVSGGPVTVTHPEITRYFMTIEEACQLVLEAAAMGKGGEVFIFDMGKSVKILDLAHKMIRLSGLEPGKDIDVVFTGLREGEKLYEELLANSENTIPTHHSKIMIAKVKESPYMEIKEGVEFLDRLVHDKNELKMVALMKELVPEFISNYSKFEVLDRKEEEMF
jgi:FlaA1/EpsC-like NDP-sugar epimerase